MIFDMPSVDASGIAVRRDDKTGLKVKARKRLVPLVSVAGEENIIVLADFPQRFIFRPVYINTGFFCPALHGVAHGEAGQEVFRQDDQASIRTDKSLAGCNLCGARLDGRVNATPGVGNAQGIDRPAAGL